MLAVWMFACANPDPVRIDGIVYADQDPLSAPLPAATLTFVDVDGAVLDEVTSDADGAFTARVPQSTNLFVEVTGSGYAITTFPGVTGLDAQMEVPEHTFYGQAESVRQDWLDRFAGCPGAETDGAVVIGEIRIFGLVDPLTGGSPTTNDGVATVQGADGGSWDACYLDAAGLIYDPASDRTGTTGFFAVFGVPPGIHDLAVQYEFVTDNWAFAEYPLWIPDRNDVVAPWYPAWVEWPL